MIFYLLHTICILMHIFANELVVSPMSRSIVLIAAFNRLIIIDRLAIGRYLKELQ